MLFKEYFESPWKLLTIKFSWISCSTANYLAVEIHIGSLGLELGVKNYFLCLIEDINKPANFIIK